MECIELRARSEGESLNICSGRWEGYDCGSSQKSFGMFICFHGSLVACMLIFGCRELWRTVSEERRRRQRRRVRRFF